MKIGIPTEIKTQEYRVGLVPNAVRELTDRGHEVIVQRGAGQGTGFSDADYESVGASICATIADVYGEAQMIVKVKEPQESEINLMSEGQILFAYLHLAPEPERTAQLLASKCVAIAYETITDNSGGLPLLAPMSEIAGRLAPQEGARFLAKQQGGRGVLIGRIPGVQPGRVVIIGGGVSGRNAASVAIGMGAEVTILDRSLPVLRSLWMQFGENVRLLYSTRQELLDEISQADVVIGAALIPGAKTPRLILKDDLKIMRPGAVLVDISVDQGGVFETTRATTHADPVYSEGGIIHYCVSNMPGSVPLTSSKALNNATLPATIAIANLGWKEAMRRDAHLAQGLGVCDGAVVNQPTAEALGLDFTPVGEILS